MEFGIFYLFRNSQISFLWRNYRLLLLLLPLLTEIQMYRKHLLFYFIYLYHIIFFSFVFIHNFFSYFVLFDVRASVFNSESNDAIVYGDFDENILQRATNNIGVFEFGANHNGCCNCNNDWNIIRYAWINLCTIGNTRFFPSEYILEKGFKRYRHSSSTIVACSWPFSIVPVSARVAVYGLFQNHTRTHNCKLSERCDFGEFNEPLTILNIYIRRIVETNQFSKNWYRIHIHTKCLTTVLLFCFLCKKIFR